MKNVKKYFIELVTKEQELYSYKDAFVISGILILIPILLTILTF